MGPGEGGCPPSLEEASPGAKLAGTWPLAPGLPASRREIQVWCVSRRSVGFCPGSRSGWRQGVAMGEAGAAPHRCRAEHAAETSLLAVTPGEALAMPTSPPPGHRQEARPGQSPAFRALGPWRPHSP